MCNLISIYKVLCALRIATVFIPQIGYIHPDEHFQGPEIAYGNLIFFNVTIPIEIISKVVDFFLSRNINNYICFWLFVYCKPGLYNKIFRGWFNVKRPKLKTFKH